MSDLLAEIKARQDQWSTVTPVCIHEDVGWLISEVERLTEDMNIAHQEISRRNDAGMEQAADVVSAWPIAARLIRAAARAEVKRG